MSSMYDNHKYRIKIILHYEISKLLLIILCYTKHNYTPCSFSMLG